MHFYVSGKKTAIHTYFSHGIPEYDDHLLGSVARQLKLRRDDLDALIDCPMSEDEYRDYLIAGGHVRL